MPRVLRAVIQGHIFHALSIVLLCSPNSKGKKSNNRFPVEYCIKLKKKNSMILKLLWCVAKIVWSECSLQCMRYVFVAFLCVFLLISTFSFHAANASLFLPLLKPQYTYLIDPSGLLTCKQSIHTVMGFYPVWSIRQSQQGLSVSRSSCNSDNTALIFFFCNGKVKN